MKESEPGKESIEPRDDAVQVHLISLGCPKNLVDSEMILGSLGSYGLVVTPEPEQADVIVVNTCGFIDSARQESIDTILEACELKSSSSTPKKVVVTGCLGQRHGEELKKEIPELDAIIGLGEYEELGTTLLELTRGERGEAHYQVSDPTKACNAEVGRFRLTPRHYAYIRISEGCDNPCTFCAIPAIRGRFRSKPIPMILAEARELVADGAKEIILISQDTTSYGVDLDGRFQLDRLLRELNDVGGLEWIRVLYAYPAYTTIEMIDAIAELPKVLNYVDIPLQHISDNMLRRMGRRMNESKTRELLLTMRERIPELYLRTTFILGFPGETDADFETLRSFVSEMRFERMGVFPYSQEEGTPAAGFAHPVPEDLMQERIETLMLEQQKIAFEQNSGRRGETLEVIIDSVTESSEGLIFTARSYGEAPEIDPVILVTEAGMPTAALSDAEKAAENFLEKDGFLELPLGNGPSEAGSSETRPSETRHVGLVQADLKHRLRVGDIAGAKIIGSREYDLYATLTS